MVHYTLLQEPFFRDAFEAQCAPEWGLSSAPRGRGLGLSAAPEPLRPKRPASTSASTSASISSSISISASISRLGSISMAISDPAQLALLAAARPRPQFCNFQFVLIICIRLEREVDATRKSNLVDFAYVRMDP